MEITIVETLQNRSRLLEQLELIARIAMARTATFESAAFITAPEVIKLEFLRVQTIILLTVPGV